jgi:hypothetical protein
MEIAMERYLKKAMESYISRRKQREFARALSSIRREIGASEDIDLDGSFGVEGSTFRAYRGWRRSPSEIYQSWAQKHTKLILRRLPTDKISSRRGFIEWHSALHMSLKRHWSRNEGRQLSIAHGYKLIDLFVKHLSRHQFADMRFVPMLVRNANCPLDQKTIRELNLCYSRILPIRSSPSMGDIHSQETYDFCQAMISVFCKECGGSRLLFDFWAWR